MSCLQSSNQEMGRLSHTTKIFGSTGLSRRGDLALTSEGNIFQTERLIMLLVIGGRKSGTMTSPVTNPKLGHTLRVRIASKAKAIVTRNDRNVVVVEGEMKLVSFLRIHKKRSRLSRSVKQLLFQELTLRRRRHQ